MDELLSDFLTETSESLAALDTALLRLERAPADPETLSTVFRSMHTIKGTCGFLDLPRLERVAHAAEDLLGEMRDGTLLATPALITLVLATLDRIKLIVAGIAATGAETPGDDARLIADLRAMLPGETAADTVPEPPVAEPPPEAAPAEAGLPEPASQSIRVNVEVIETLMTLVSELVLTRNQLMQLARTRQDQSYTAPLQRLSHLTSDLQEGVMKTRMQPIGHAWSKLPRLIRDLGQELRKPMRLVMLGQETELDRQVLEMIRDPLTHMVRNSADHGLESPPERILAGKPATGTVTLNAYHQGGHIIIEVGDDGAGLNVGRIRAKAAARGLASEAELATMSDRQLQAFIFRAGFSTAAAVTAISGRGVGMDVVKTNIERIGGTVDVLSTAGQGTNFTIKIPLTLAIISALIVQAAGERFALPQTSVVELVRTEMRRPGERGGARGGGPTIERIDATPMLRLREELLPLVYLADLLQLDRGEETLEDDGKTIVVAAVGACTLGIVVDRVFDTEEIVVKPVSPMLRHITMFSGNTILGDGTVIMILDPNGIARSSGMSAGVEERRVRAVSTRLERTGDRTALLLFRVAQGSTPCAVPLGLVARIESIPRAQIETSSGRPVTQYRGQLMPLIAIDGSATLPDQVPLLVFTDRGRSMGLMVGEIVDVVEEQLVVELAALRPGLLGTAVIAGRVTDVIDAGHWLMQASRTWFVDGAPGLGAQREHPRVLVVEDSAFFRQLLVPTLSAAGYEVTAVESAAKALLLRDSAAADGEFDAIISDIEMPDMDGLAFARRLREGGRWQHLPLIALSGRITELDVARGSEAGFTDYIGKFDRESLLGRLRTCLATAAACPAPTREAA